MKCASSVFHPTRCEIVHFCGIAGKSHAHAGDRGEDWNDSNIAALGIFVDCDCQ
jgi:hypothetical protein